MKCLSHVLLTLLIMFNLGVSQAGQEFITKPSHFSVAETLDKLEKILKKKGVTVFSRIDHAAGAKSVGMKMRPAQLLIFGNPKMGSPLINENPLISLDLPIKVLAWQDKKGKTWVSYLNPAVLKARYNIKNDKLINKMTNVLNKLTNKALAHNHK
ncbi:hypothetical protein MNBD_GAMMA07-649 [hydrothermal vent metagenome]|uniref:DUF302 domain-containing protein n=1 Tax=hydrothermal vent metagenome TaxID=652676 RepID=A0A3B0WJ97_9ZZZZ